jgi:hypothetical protein
VRLDCFDKWIAKGWNTVRGLEYFEYKAIIFEPANYYEMEDWLDQHACCCNNEYDPYTDVWHTQTEEDLHQWDWEFDFISTAQWRYEEYHQFEFDCIDSYYDEGEYHGSHGWNLDSLLEYNKKEQT